MDLKVRSKHDWSSKGVRRMKRLLRHRSPGMNGKKKLYEGIVVQIVLYYAKI